MGPECDGFWECIGSQKQFYDPARHGITLDAMSWGSVALYNL